MVSRVFSAALNGGVNWPWSGEESDESQTMGIKDLETDSQTKVESRRGIGGPQEKDVGRR